jgi:hypothetical protein
MPWSIGAGVDAATELRSRAAKRSMSTLHPTLRAYALCLALLALSLQVLGPLLHARALLAQTAANGGFPVGLTLCRADGQASQPRHDDAGRKTSSDCLLCQTVCSTGSASPPSFAYTTPRATEILRPQAVAVASHPAATDHPLPFSRGPPTG